MPLSRVTMTGADDQNSIDEMVAISEEFPFVEWGILIGSSAGPRFPSFDWIGSLAQRATQKPLQLSLHICGQWLRDIKTNQPARLQEWLDWTLGTFDRVQLNWHGEAQSGEVAEMLLRSFGTLTRGGWWEPELIFQMDGVNNHIATYCMEGRFVVSGLFDRSHGAGVSPGEWPASSGHFPCGWAGGLGPHNLEAELPRIDAAAMAGLNYWVDMETHVHSGASGLDMGKVRTCLGIAESFMTAAARE